MDDPSLELLHKEDAKELSKGDTANQARIAEVHGGITCLAATTGSSNLDKELCRPFQDEPNEFDHKPTQANAAHGGKTFEDVVDDVVDEADFAERAWAWYQQDSVQGRLAMISCQPFRKQFYKGDVVGNVAGEESQLYAPIELCIYEPVNDAARALGFECRYQRCPAGKTLADMQGVRLPHREVVLPHEVKAACQEHLVGLSYNQAFDKCPHTVLRPLAQMGAYMVEEETRYGILSSKLHHTFFSRPAKATDRRLLCSPTFNGEQQQSPSVRVLYLYQLHLAQSAPPLLVKDRGGVTPPKGKCIKEWPAMPAESAPAAAGEPAVHSPPSPSVASRGSFLTTAEDGVAGSSPPAGSPASNTRKRAREGFSSTHGARQIPLATQHESLLVSLKPVSRASLNIGDTICRASDHVVRWGRYLGQDAVFKIWDLGDSFEPLDGMQRELDAYAQLQDLQGTWTPNLLGSGLLFGDLLSFVCISAGRPLKRDVLTDADTQQMKDCLAAVHRMHVSHGDVRLSNFKRGPDGQVWLIDFDHSQIVAGKDADFICDLADLEHILIRLSSDWLDPASKV
ncbi:hypothetical protein WJX74_003982 [Apatococcus lobatus]|uniref:Uncharacterized protein n=1 Tax=Apatococcus lobatus TaxID=904363 RepID=A0AAW1RYM7_9CHLO